MDDLLPDDLQLRDGMAILALAVSLYVLWRGHRNDKRDLFLKVHEQLLNPELVDGRRILYTLGSVKDVENLTSEEHTKLYRLFAMYDLMAMYADRGWISRRTVFAEWRDSLTRSIAPARHFITYRQRVTTVNWPHYQRLALRADKVTHRRSRGGKRSLWN